MLSRIVVGYHGCEEEFARDLLLENVKIPKWKPSRNSWDWLGHGIYFWEHTPARALRWARERYAGSGKEARRYRRPDSPRALFRPARRVPDGCPRGGIPAAGEDFNGKWTSHADQRWERLEAAGARLPRDQRLSCFRSRGRHGIRHGARGFFGRRAGVSGGRILQGVPPANFRQDDILYPRNFPSTLLTMFESPSPQQLARELREALRKHPETSAEHLARLIKSGFINQGER